MAVPTYFIRGDMIRVMDRDRMLSLIGDNGLSYIVDDDDHGPIEWRSTPSGPDGHQGMTIAAHPPEASADGEVIGPIGYYPDRQDWHGPDDESNVWIGIERDRPPRPEDLVRQRPIIGHAVRLNDDREWMIPLARIFPEGTNLPKIVVPEADGTVSYRIKAEYREISRTADALREAFIPEEREDGQLVIETDLSDERVMGVCIQALALNYRVSRREIKILELITGANLKEIVLALVDWPTFVSLITPQKKKDRAPTNASASDGSGS